MRFAFEVLEEVRARVGNDFVVGMRLSLDEDAEGGIDPGRVDRDRSGARGVRTRRLPLRRLGRHDQGRRASPSRSSRSGRRSAASCPIVGEFREKVDLPVLHAGRIADLPTARHALREGYVDLVGMVRAHMADPHLVRKLEAGAGGSHPPVRGRVLLPQPDLRRPRRAVPAQPGDRARGVHPAHRAAAAQRATVVVIGGGPAGLEAARRQRRTRTLRHAVRGGAAGSAARSSSRPARTERQKELLSIVNWLEAEARQLGVQIRLNTYADRRRRAGAHPRRRGRGHRRSARPYPRRPRRSSSPCRAGTSSPARSSLPAAGAGLRRSRQRPGAVHRRAARRGRFGSRNCHPGPLRRPGRDRHALPRVSVDVLPRRGRLTPDHRLARSAARRRPASSCSATIHRRDA